MQFRKILILFISAQFLLAANVLRSQVIRNNDRGDRIVVYSDGSWRYFNESDPRDQALWEKQMNPEKIEPKVLPDTSGKDNQINMPKVVNEPYEDQQHSEQDAIDQVSFENQPAKDRQSKEQKEVVSYKARSNAGAGMTRAEAIQYARRASEIEAIAIKTEEEASLNRFFLEEDLDALLNNGQPYTKAKEKALRKKIKAAIQKEKVAKSVRREAGKKALLAAKLIDLEQEDRDKLLAKLMKNNDLYAQELKAIKNQDHPVSEATRESSPAATTATESGNPQSNSFRAATRPLPSVSNTRPNVKFVARRDVMRNPPPADCQLAFDGVDEFSGKKRRDVAQQQLFTFTSDVLKPYLKDKEFITCNANVGHIEGGYKILFLDFIIASENAQREFGILEKNSPIIITLIDGTGVQVNNNKTDLGDLDTFKKVVKYSGQYLLSADQVKAMSKKEVDKIRVVWSTGFEDYDIYNVDFFINQFQCLDSKK